MRGPITSASEYGAWSLAVTNGHATNVTLSPNLRVAVIASPSHRTPEVILRPTTNTFMSLRIRRRAPR
jgi:hypothetical protein